MSETNPVRDTQPMQSAGEMLRAARQAQGLHIAALATQLKVTPRKLELLESDQHAELQGSTFVRALAQAACRALKIDPAPVLARLPDAHGNTLDQVNGGLNAPFREHGARRAALELPQFTPTVLALVGLLLAGAAALWLVPHDWSLPLLWQKAAAPLTTPASAGGASASLGNLTTEAVSPILVGSAVVETVPAAVAPGLLLQVRATGVSWVEVTDSSGQSVLSRLLQPGETVDLDGNPPLRIKIGNAAGTELSFRGQLVDLAPSTRDNVARLELK
ncbi:MAG: helix-turn-helix domain-containing protein [Vitreoscilla sp.]|nr:helix-turn-helix domain-containing protein [Vitreoscilla sp.]